MVDKFAIYSLSVLPKLIGIIEKVFEIPSSHTSTYGSFATEFNEARGPLRSRPCIGLAPGAKGA
jgi:hypothetical protein